MPPKAAEKPQKKKRGRPPSNDNNHQAKARKTNPPQAKPQEAPKLPSRLRSSKGLKLKQLRYYQFKNDILIYHYAASFISMPNLRSLLTRQQHGYVNYLLGPDTLSPTPTPPGDEPPPGCLEVSYLPSVFKADGSALGFRLPSSPPTIEWLCFDSDVRTSILARLDISTATQHMLFEHVADLYRAPPPEKRWDRKLRYTEHRDWFRSLEEAGRRPCRLGLAWRAWGTELMIEGLRRRDEQAGLEARRAMMQGVAAMGAESHDRDADSPETIGRHTPFVYRDLASHQDAVFLKPTASNHSPSSSNASVLSDRSTNTPRTHPPSSTQHKSKEQLLLEGTYV